MAKWYQKAIMALPPMTDEKICAMPTASVGAPPAREMMVCSPTSCAVWSICSGVTANPHSVIFAAALADVVPIRAPGEFMVK